MCGAFAHLGDGAGGTGECGGVNGLNGINHSDLGFFVGDGRLNYAPERIVEIYYSLGLLPRAWITLNAQHITAPAYNADRGPVNVFGVRLHTNF